MKKSLYEISEELERINNELYDSGGDLSPELETSLAIAQQDLQTKGAGYGMVILQNRSDIAAIEAEIERLQSKLIPLKNANNRLETAISEAMQRFGIMEIKTPVVRLNFRKSHQVVIQDETAIPDEYMVVVPATKRPDKKAIKEVINGGGEVAGATIVENQNLQIK